MSARQLFERLQLPVGIELPSFDGATAWLNSTPLTPEHLHGKVVLVDFWTYTCVNWLRTLPYLRAWHDAYAQHGLVVVGVHTPEFGIEHDLDRVERAAHTLRVAYPIAIDNDYEIWNAFGNHFWPALYLADADGSTRHQHFGEGGYERTERAIRTLVLDAGADELPEPSDVHPQGLEVPASRRVRSRETYLGAARASGFASPEGIGLEVAQSYSLPPHLRVNNWALEGDWTLQLEEAVSNEANGRLAYRFHARDVNLILVPPDDDTPVPFRVSIDGAPPGDDQGLDVDGDGRGGVHDARLYQLVRRDEPGRDGLFEIEFFEPGIAALCFTFG
jgi:thiol-disulfide isomerase/thioredoxin